MPSPITWLPPPPWEGPPVPRWCLTGPEDTSIKKPGCTAADGALLALGHLDGLARGLGGFGVLRVSKEKLEEAASAADQLGKRDLAEQMRGVAEKMPQVRTTTAAQSLADDLRPLIDTAWDLGRRCGGHLGPEQLSKARVLARQVRDGRMTMDHAIEQVQQEGVDAHN